MNCDGCKSKGILGVRYKCAVCADFDFCSKCEASIDHPHPFLKIKTLSQTPLKIVAILNDEHNSFEVNGQRHQFPGLGGLIHHGMNFAQHFLGKDEKEKERCQFFKSMLDQIY